jgi:hypothetical protein
MRDASDQQAMRFRFHGYLKVKKWRACAAESTNDNGLPLLYVNLAMGQYGPSSPGNHGIDSHPGKVESASCRRDYCTSCSNPPLSASLFLLQSIT